jgi:hypothetical protein
MIKGIILAALLFGVAGFGAAFPQWLGSQAGPAMSAMHPNATDTSRRT